MDRTISADALRQMAPFTNGQYGLTDALNRAADTIAELEKKLEFARAVEAGDSALINGLQAENQRLRGAATALRISQVLAEMDADDGWALVPRHSLEDLQAVLEGGD